MRALEKLKEITLNLKKARIPSPEREAELILTSVTKLDRVKLYSHNPEISRNQESELDLFVLRRLRREPLQYIIGECEFFGLKIRVGQGVLIPRPETEILVEEFLKDKTVIRKSKATVLDLCTGSGVIALAIGKNRPTFKIFGIDISKRAVEYAVINRRLNQISNVFFLVGDLFLPLKGTFDFITANPPYLKTSEIETLEPEIREYEPLIALDAGVDGLSFYRVILIEAPKYLSKDGLIFLEIGYGQSSQIQALAQSFGFETVRVVKDLAGVERVVVLRRGSTD